MKAIRKNLLLFLGLSISAFVFAQADTSRPVYERFPTPPPFQIMLSDSATIYTKAQLPKNKAVLFLIFSPECSHCQHETEQILAHKNELKDVQIVMITLHPVWMMREFVNRYRLNEQSNIVVGRDFSYTLPSFYNFRNLPYMAMYDRKGNLITTYEGAMGIPQVIELFAKQK